MASELDSFLFHGAGCTEFQIVRTSHLPNLNLKWPQRVKEICWLLQRCYDTPCLEVWCWIKPIWFLFVYRSRKLNRSGKRHDEKRWWTSHHQCYEGFFGTCLNNIPLLELQHFGMFVPSKDLSCFLTHRFRRVSHSWTGARQDPKATRWISWRIGGVLEISFKGREFTFFLIPCECPWNRNKKHLPKNWTNLQIGRGWRGPYGSIIVWRFQTLEVSADFFSNKFAVAELEKIDQACKCRFELDY